MRYKLLSIITLILLIVMLQVSVTPVLAADIGNLTYWYSDSTLIGRWTSSPNMCSTKLNSNTSFYYATGLASGRSEWNSALGLTMSVSSTGAIRFYGGTKSELEATGLFNLTSTYCGLTTGLSYAYEGEYTWGNTTKYGYIYNGADCCIVDKGMTSNMCKEVAAHELGHALGHSGHDTSYATSVMYTYAHENYTLNSRDKNHMKQVY